MKKWISLAKKYFNRIRGLFPEALPFTPNGMDDYVARMMATYWLPTTQERDVAWVTASNIAHFGPLVTRKPMYFFVLAIRAAGAKQIAGDKFRHLKEEQQAEMQAAQQALATQNEATKLHAVASEPQV